MAKLFANFFHCLAHDHHIVGISSTVFQIFHRKVSTELSPNQSPPPWSSIHSPQTQTWCLKKCRCLMQCHRHHFVDFSNPTQPHTTTLVVNCRQRTRNRPNHCGTGRPGSSTTKRTTTPRCRLWFAPLFPHRPAPNHPSTTFVAACPTTQNTTNPSRIACKVNHIVFALAHRSTIYDF